MKICLKQTQKMLEWLKTKLYIDSNAENAKKRIVKRGQVYRCNFGCGVGSEIQKERPAVIVQNDIANMKSGNTLVIPITHDNSTLPCVADITAQKNSSGDIILDGQANASNMMCVSKARLGDYVTDLLPSDMKEIDIAIAKHIGLMPYYAKLLKKLDDKLSYIEQLKMQRNSVQDELEAIRTTLELDKDTSLLEFIQNTKNS